MADETLDNLLEFMVVAMIVIMFGIAGFTVYEFYDRFYPIWIFSFFVAFQTIHF